MLSIDAEDDGFLEAIATFLEVVGDPLGDALRARIDDDGAVEILDVVYPIVDFDAQLIDLALLRSGR